MNAQAGVWIDHRHAIIVDVSNNGATTKTIESHVEKRVKGYGGSRSSTPYSHQEVSAGDRIERKYRGHLDHYYAEVEGALHGADSVLILGPGEAKMEFKTHLEKHVHDSVPTIAVEAADKITEPQIVAKVKRHFSD